jgi:RNA polymerase sigma-70 factor, ECF subfamily
MAAARGYVLMEPPTSGDPGETSELLRRAAAGDRASWGRLLQGHRDRLRRMVTLRLDPRLRGRLDPSDVLQEAYLEASARLADYLARPTMPFFLWLRFLAGQKMVTLHRRHLGVHMRAAGREVSLHRGGLPETTTGVLADRLLARDPRPSEAAAREELKLRLREALDAMGPIDREVLALRHFEHLSRAETAEVLGIQEAAVSKRYVRALKRLKDLLGQTPGGLTGFAP